MTEDALLSTPAIKSILKGDSYQISQISQATESALPATQEIEQIMNKESSTRIDSASNVQLSTSQDMLQLPSTNEVYQQINNNRCEKSHMSAAADQIIKTA